MQGWSKVDCVTLWLPDSNWNIKVSPIWASTELGEKTGSVSARIWRVSANVFKLRWIPTVYVAAADKLEDVKLGAAVVDADGTILST